MNWHYADAGQSVGPLSEEEFQRLVQAGTIAATTLVWHEGLAEWTPYASLAAAGSRPVAASATTEGSGTCVQCGRQFPAGDMVQYEGASVCAACKPAFFQRVQEGASVPGLLDYAGFWIRFAAKFVDTLILWGVSMVISLAASGLGLATGAAGNPAALVGVQGVLILLQLAIGVSYTVYFLGRFGATPGKMACKLRVVRSDGSPVTYGRAFGRHFAEWLSGLILYIGYIMVGFDDEKRSLHDRVCDTRVVRVS